MSLSKPGGTLPQVLAERMQLWTAQGVAVGSVSRGEEEGGFQDTNLSNGEVIERAATVPHQGFFVNVVFLAILCLIEEVIK